MIREIKYALINLKSIYLRKIEAENKILFYFHDAQSDSAMVAKSFLIWKA